MRSVGARLFVGFFVIIVVLSVVAVTSMMQISRFRYITTEIANHHAAEIMLYGELQRVLLRLKVDVGTIHFGGSRPQLDQAWRQYDDFDRLIRTAITLQTQYPDSLSGDVVTRLRESRDYVHDGLARIDTLAAAGRWPDARGAAIMLDHAAIDGALKMCAQYLVDEDEQLVQITHDIVTRSTEARNKILVISVLALLASVVIAVLTTFRATRPIRALEKTAVAIAGGDLSLRSGLKGSDEPARLSRAFDYMVDSLEKVLAEQRKFLADTSHNLLTPVTVVQGQLQVMDRATDAERDQALKIVFKELARIKEIVNDLVVLAKSSATQALSVETVSVPVFLDTVFREVEVLGERSWHLGPVPSVTIVCDTSLMTTALQELVRNAIQHTEHGDRIHLSATVDRGQLRFQVEDGGSGIPLDEQPQVFERFYRGKKSRKRGEGSGLGLSIVKAVAEVHGGSVEVSSQPGRGTRISLSVPLSGPPKRNERILIPG